MSSQDPNRARINAVVEETVNSLARELGIHREVVADFAYLYLQVKYRNATTAQKNASHVHWEGICQCVECKKAKTKVARPEAVFHHVERRVPGQHEPASLRPYHPKHHDKAHGVVRGSLSKGSPSRKRPEDSDPPERDDPSL